MAKVLQHICRLFWMRDQKSALSVCRNVVVGMSNKTDQLWNTKETISESTKVMFAICPWRSCNNGMILIMRTRLKAAPSAAFKRVYSCLGGVSRKLKSGLSATNQLDSLVQPLLDGIATCFSRKFLSSWVQFMVVSRPIARTMTHWSGCLPDSSHSSFSHQRESCGGKFE